MKQPFKVRSSFKKKEKNKEEVKMARSNWLIIYLSGSTD